MEFPSTFLTSSDVAQLEEEGRTVIPYGVGRNPNEAVAFAATIYEPDRDTVSTWRYHPKKRGWEVKDSIETEEVKTRKVEAFEGDIFVFGEAGRDVETAQKDLGAELSRYLSAPPFIYDSSTAAELQEHAFDGDCSCSPEDTDKLAVIKMGVRNGDPVPLVSCTKCDRPYRIGGASGSVSIDSALQHDWVFSKGKPEMEKSSDNLEFYYVNPPCEAPIHLVIAALISDVNAEIILAQDYNVDSDEFLLISDGTQIIGFLSWNWEWETPTLNQIYLREEYRGQGFAKEALLVWCDWIEGDFAYADHLNEASRSLFRDIGLLETGNFNFTIQEFIDFYPQIMKMDANFYDAYPVSAFPDEFGIK